MHGRTKKTSPLTALLYGFTALLYQFIALLYQLTALLYELTALLYDGTEDTCSPMQHCHTCTQGIPDLTDSLIAAPHNKRIRMAQTRTAGRLMNSARFSEG